MISAVIVTYNSAHEVGGCLASLADFASEIIVFDLNSTDDTQKIAAEYGAKIFDHVHVDYVELVRQEAIMKASNSWVVLLDPDERLSTGLKAELKKISADSVYAAVNIPRKNIFFGTWIKHTNFWPDRQIRFFQKEKITWSTKIHSYPQITGKVLDLEAKDLLAIEHYGYNNFSEFFDRQNRYSNIEAERGKFDPINLIWKPLREFLVRFVKHGAFLDGFLGMALVYALMITQFTIQVKLWEKSPKLAS